MSFGSVGMVAADEVVGGPGPRPASKTRHERLRPWRVAIFLLALLYFVGPLVSAFKFSLIQSNGSYGLGNYGQVVQNSAIRSALFTSLEISAITAVLVVVLMLPTVVWVRLRLPKLTLMMEGLTLLPIVIPPVVMAAGLEELQSHAPEWTVRLLFNNPLTALTPFYVILALPFTYRALDNGVRAIDLHTLVDASRNLGASWRQTITYVILPNVETAVFGAMFLTIALCLGEVVISSLLLYRTFPVALIQESLSGTAGISVALSIITLAFTFGLLFALSFLAGRRQRTSSIRVI
ncbi:MAG: ABC transporter permease subunit [Solirubrobacteraceae bacterium]